MVNSLLKNIDTIRLIYKHSLTIPSFILNKPSDVNLRVIVYQTQFIHANFGQSNPLTHAKIPWTFDHFTGHIYRGFKGLKNFARSISI